MDKEGRSTQEGSSSLAHYNNTLIPLYRQVLRTMMFTYPSPPEVPHDGDMISPIATLVDEEREARVLRKKERFPQLEYNKPARSDHENSSPGSSQR